MAPAAAPAPLPVERVVRTGSATQGRSLPRPFSYVFDKGSASPQNTSVEIAVDAPPASYLLNAGTAADVGITLSDVEGVLVAVAPVVGTPRVVGATGNIARASVTIGGMGVAPVRVRELEQALLGRRPDDKLLRAACEACRTLDAVDDVHAPASYRQHLATVMARRALEQARARLPGEVRQAH